MKCKFKKKTLCTCVYQHHPLLSVSVGTWPEKAWGRWWWPRSLCLRSSIRTLRYGWTLQNVWYMLLLSCPPYKHVLYFNGSHVLLIWNERLVLYSMNVMATLDYFLLDLGCRNNKNKTQTWLLCACFLPSDIKHWATFSNTVHHSLFLFLLTLTHLFLNCLVLCSCFTPQFCPHIFSSVHFPVCAEPLQPGKAEYPWPSPEGCSSGREPREGDGASVSNWSGRPATSRRQAHPGAAQERWHQGLQGN